MDPVTTATAPAPTVVEMPAPKPAAPAHAPLLSPEQMDIIFHDLFLLGLAAGSFFIKNPKTAARAGNVVSILQGMQLGAPAGN